MPQLTIPAKVWKEFEVLAEKQRQKPEALAERALRAYLQRAADEDLLERSARAARRADFCIGETEALIKHCRRRK
jgi:hypothetical protein